MTTALLFIAAYSGLHFSYAQIYLTNLTEGISESQRKVEKQDKQQYKVRKMM